jgi:sarcosine oxidase gamma subunit
MVDPSAPAFIEIDGLSVTLELDQQIASLRYFSAAGQFAAGVRSRLGWPLGEPLRAGHGDSAMSGADFCLAWRSPTETLLLTRNRIAFVELAQRLAAEADGCMVEQTGGWRLFRVKGSRARDLLLRLGSATSIPDLGEARPGRFAELTVLAASIRAGEYLLLVERVYANHLVEWMSATAADLC